jgi:excisionase family DNA binding protein
MNANAPLLNVTETAVLARVDVQTVRRAIRDGRLPAELHGRTVRLRLSDVEAWTASRIRAVVPRRRPKP